MNKLPTKPLSLIPLIIKIIKSYHLVFSCTIWLVAVSSIGHLIIPFLLQQNTAFASVATVAFILFTWFLYTVILVKSNIKLSGGNITTLHAFSIAKHHYLRVLGSNIIFFAVGIVLMLIEFSLNLIFDLINLHPMYLVLSFAINIAIFVYLYFAIPEIALERISILHAFTKSVHLVRNNWWRTFIVLAFVGAVILGFEALGILFTGKNRLFLFTGYHFLLQCIFYPLIITATLVLLNDLKLRATRKIVSTSNSIHGGHHATSFL